MSLIWKLNRSFCLAASKSIPAQRAKVGDILPNVEVVQIPAKPIMLHEKIKQKRVVILGVVGAFTPACSKVHVSGYVRKAADIRSRGIDDIYCISVNDPFVLMAWAKELEADRKVEMLADPNAQFAKALNLTIGVPLLGGVRSRRFSLIADKGKITALNIEPDGVGLTCSVADELKI